MPEKSLRTLLNEGALVVAPGAYDALMAKLVEAAGFEAVYMTGYGTSASHGFPDMGLLTMTEMVANAARMAGAVDLPVIADADTGYGNEENVARTVFEFERAGVAAIHLEDQTWPKRCGHMEGKSVIDCDAMVDKLKAAVDARQSEDFVLIARTDAIAVEGFDAALDRAAAYAEAGADVLFVEAPVSMEQLAAVPERLPQRPHLVNIAPRTPLCSSEEYEAMGYTLAIHPGACLSAAWTACEEALRELKETGRQQQTDRWRERFNERNAFLGANLKGPSG